MMYREKFWRDVALGAAAGLAGTIVLQALRAAEQKWIPGGAPPIQEDPGKFMLHKTAPSLPRPLQKHVPSIENAVSKILAIGYGMSFGALYAGARAQRRRLVTDGVILGLVSWAAGFLGWLPATRLMPPIWKHKPKQIATPIAEHALYGLATTAGLRLLQKAL